MRKAFEKVCPEFKSSSIPCNTCLKYAFCVWSAKIPTDSTRGTAAPTRVESWTVKIINSFDETLLEKIKAKPLSLTSFAFKSVKFLSESLLPNSIKLGASRVVFRISPFPSLTSHSYLGILAPR